MRFRREQRTDNLVDQLFSAEAPRVSEILLRRIGTSQKITDASVILPTRRLNYRRVGNFLWRASNFTDAPVKKATKSFCDLLARR